MCSCNFVGIYTIYVAYALIHVKCFLNGVLCSLISIRCLPSEKLLISILPKNHAGPVEKMISDFFRMPKKLAQ